MKRVFYLLTTLLFLIGCREPDLRKKPNVFGFINGAWYPPPDEELRNSRISNIRSTGGPIATAFRFTQIKEGRFLLDTRIAAGGLTRWPEVMLAFNNDESEILVSFFNHDLRQKFQLCKLKILAPNKVLLIGSGDEKIDTGFNQWRLELAKQTPDPFSSTWKYFDHWDEVGFPGGDLKKRYVDRQGVVVSKDGLNVRAEPSRFGRIVKVLPNGTRVKIQQLDIAAEINGKIGYWVAIGPEEWVFDGFLRYD